MTTRLPGTSAPDQPDVVVIGPAHVDSFASNIADGFDDLGLKAQVLDPFASFAGAGSLRAYGRFGAAMRRMIDLSGAARDRLVDRPMARSLEALNPRLVVNVYAYFGPDQVESWRRLTPRASWALWYPDHFSNLGPHRMLLAPYDRLFFKDPYIVRLFDERAGLPAHYLAQACNPRLHHRARADHDGPVTARDVVVVGNLYTYRLLLLEGLAEDVDLKIYGNLRSPLPERFARLSAAHTGRAVFGTEKACVFEEAGIVLNTMHYGEVGGINSRLFEATASGAFVLSHACEGLDRYFEPGAEVAVFDSMMDLNASIVHYLADPEGRAEIARRGELRTHRDHTYAVRLKALLEVCGLDTDPVFAGDRRSS